MSFQFITKFKVQRTGSGQHSRSITLKVFDDLEEAIQWVRDNFDINDEKVSISVVEYRYTSKENLQKDFAFDYHYRWSSYFHD